MWSSLRVFFVISVLTALGILNFFRDTRDGTVPRIGNGKPKQWGKKLTIPASKDYRPYPLNVYYVESNDEAPIYCALLLVHGTCGHGGTYGDFEKKFRELSHHRCNVYAVDQQGHGLTPGINEQRGLYRMANLIDDIGSAANFIKHRLAGKGANGKAPPLFTVGFSQGGELAFIASNHYDSIDASASMNLMLFSETNMKTIIRLLKSPIGEFLETLLGDFKLPIYKFFDFKGAYDWDEEPSLYEGKLQDPLSTWEYGYASYRSVFAYQPPRNASQYNKPVLVLHGEKDPSIPISHAKLCFDRIGGNPSWKKFVPFENGRHQLANRHLHEFTTVLFSWIESVIENKHTQWESRTITVSPTLV